MKAERRYLPAGMSRLSVGESRKDKAKTVIEGYGAVFYDAADAGTEFQLWSDAVERIMPTAFDRALREDDVRSLFNHDSNFVLGRNTAGTLELSVDRIGLRYTATPPASQTIRDLVIEPIQRGDIDGSSFMFLPRRPLWITETDDNGNRRDIRQIVDAELFELGPVTFPAYEATTAGTRGRAGGLVIRGDAGDLSAIRAEHAAWKASGLSGREFAEREAEAVAVRLRAIRAVA